jgi:hypothetical protein
MTLDGKFTGDYNSAYNGKITTTFARPIGGLSSITTTISATYLGACPANIKPGSATTTLPGETEDIDLNDPKIKALLEQLKAGASSQQ